WLAVLAIWKPQQNSWRGKSDLRGRSGAAESFPRGIGLGIPRVRVTRFRERIAARHAAFRFRQKRRPAQPRNFAQPLEDRDILRVWPEAVIRRQHGPRNRTRC